MGDSTPINVQHLKTIGFSSLPLEEKIKIKSAGRPKPYIHLTNITKCKGRDYKRTFKMETYEKYDWICGCDVSNSLYCFPCLLFADHDQTEWTKSGFTDLGHLVEKIKKHQSSKTHLSSKLGFNLLGKQGIRQQLNSAYRVNIEKHNAQVKRNRYVLSKIIDCVKFCGGFELPLRGRDEGENSLNSGIFKGLINFSAELDLALGEHLQQGDIFKESNTAKDIQNDLLDCMLSVSQAYIKKEVADSKYVSIISDETSDISDIFQVVAVLRYTLKNGTPVERFWGFEELSGGDPASLAACIENVLNYVLKAPDQLISQSYGGSNVMSNAHSGVQKFIIEKFPYAYNIHCYAHDLNSVISQVASVNKNARIFFSELSDVTDFFSNSPERVAVLNEIIGNKIPNACTTECNFKSRTVTTVYELREYLVECMEKIRSTSRQSSTIVKASALLRMFNDSKFVFWLTVFHRLIPHIQVFFSQVQEKTSNFVNITAYIAKFEKIICGEKDIIHTIEESEICDNETNQYRKRRKLDESKSDVSVIIQAKEVCDAILSEIKTRFSFTGHMEMAKLFSAEQFKTALILSQHLEIAVCTLPFVDKNRLKTELEVFYKTADFTEVSGAVHLLKFLIENDLQEDLSETSSVLQAIVTMPMMTTETERCFSTLKRIKTFLRSVIGQDRVSALAMLSIEKEMIQSIPNFNELVIEEFILKKQRVDFQYKTYL